MAEIGAEASDVEVVARPKRKKIRVELIRETISSKDESDSSDGLADMNSTPEVTVSAEDKTVPTTAAPRKVVPKRKPRPRPTQRNNKPKPIDNSNKEKLSINDLSRKIGRAHV